MVRARRPFATGALRLALSVVLSVTSLTTAPAQTLDPRASALGGDNRTLPTGPDQEDAVSTTSGLPAGATIICATPDYVKRGGRIETIGTWGGTNGFGVYWQGLGSRGWRYVGDIGATSLVVRTIAQFPSETELVWIGTDLGLNLSVEKGVGELNPATTWTSGEGLPGDDVTSLARGTGDSMWIGTRSGLAAILDFRNSPRLVKSWTSAQGLPNDQVTSLALASPPADKPRVHPVMWVGTVGGLVGIDLLSNEVTRPVSKEDGGLDDSWVRSVNVVEVKEDRSLHHVNHVASQYDLATSTLASNRDGARCFQQRVHVETYAQGTDRVWETTTRDPRIIPWRLRYKAQRPVYEPTSIVPAFGTVVFGTHGDGLYIDLGVDSLFTRSIQDIPRAQPLRYYRARLDFAKGTEVGAAQFTATTTATAGLRDMPEDDSLPRPEFTTLAGSLGPDPTKPGPDGKVPG